MLNKLYEILLRWIDGRIDAGYKSFDKERPRINEPTPGVVTPHGILVVPGTTIYYGGSTSIIADRIDPMGGLFVTDISGMGTLKGSDGRDLMNQMDIVDRYTQQALLAKHTDRLRLIKMRSLPDDPDNIIIDTIVGWLNDPEIVRYSEQRHTRHTRKSQLKYFADTLTSNDEYWFIGMQDRERGISKALIGGITLQFDKSTATVNIGIMIGDKSAWGYGYALEAMTAMINRLAGKGFRRFEIGTHIDNIRMIRLAMVCGMKVEHADGEHVYMAAVT